MPHQRGSFGAGETAASSRSNLKGNKMTTPTERESMFSKRPMSLGSTTTLVMNEKAKALREEITTLDDEIQ